MKKRIVVLASGDGSNFTALQQNIEQGKLSAQICAVISDQSQARVLERAKALNIPTRVVPFQKNRDQHALALLEVLQEFQPDFIVLAGFMRILSPCFLEAFRSPRGYSRVVNIHPSLLPAFPGVHSYAQAFQFGAKVAGVSVHFVEEGVDSGPICAQEAFSIEDCLTEDEVRTRGLQIEHRLFASTLEWILKEEFQFQALPAGRFCVRKN